MVVPLALALVLFCTILYYTVLYCTVLTCIRVRALPRSGSSPSSSPAARSSRTVSTSQSSAWPASTQYSSLVITLVLVLHSPRGAPSVWRVFLLSRRCIPTQTLAQHHSRDKIAPVAILLRRAMGKCKWKEKIWKKSEVKKHNCGQVLAWTWMITVKYPLNGGLDVVNNLQNLVPKVPKESETPLQQQQHPTWQTLSSSSSTSISILLLSQELQTIRWGEYWRVFVAV